MEHLTEILGHAEVMVMKICERVNNKTSIKTIEEKNSKYVLQTSPQQEI